MTVFSSLSSPAIPHGDPPPRCDSRVSQHQPQSEFCSIVQSLTLSLLFLRSVVSIFLDRPDLTVKKRRGGQRMRRLKGRYEETALMKQANTRAFSIQTGEYGDDAMGRTLGLLEMSTGSVGASATTEHSSIRSKNNIEQKKMKYANTRASRKKAAQMNRQGLAVASSSLDSNNANRSNGMASSMVFTPVQGMELVNPDAMKDRVKEANRKWFSTNAGFQSAVPPKK